ncbi:hypothetical protein M427DRAFT_54759 [Gonapodya prolifera JEL478]|uniref:LIM zinc-binding domain-containing protein n=1 Tax=Gonapodya prolifera (strain JEL478) TaxID=1344416 RepID=A0A139AK00_GONPJ|nr:hypothetical protein M427DRAFT_54759 [Gonapodya prolifera JEL478]|eukprot:KXS17101.1 hypothetical protein M427DRAFT_54759 [Gonapodya prolifera JEL478]
MKLGNFAFNAGRYYCKPHFKQLFAIKGNYSGGFQNDNKSPSSFNPSGYGMPADGATALGRKPSLIRDRLNAIESKQGAGAGGSPLSVNGSTQQLAQSDSGVSPGSAVRERALFLIHCFNDTGSMNDDQLAKDKLVESLRQQLEERDAQIALLKQENDALRAKLQLQAVQGNSTEQLREETPNASSALVAQDEVEQPAESQ